MLAILQAMRERSGRNLTLKTDASLKTQNLSPLSNFIKSITNELGQDVFIGNSGQSTTHEFVGQGQAFAESFEKDGTIFTREIDIFRIKDFLHSHPDIVQRQFRVNIIGGTGSIGQLVTLWISEMTYMTCDINIFGRQAHNTSREVLKSTFSLTIVQGDCSRSADWYYPGSGNQNGPLLNLLLSGKTEDMHFMRMLPKNLRATNSSKVPCLKWMLDTSRCNPVLLDVVFSSMVATFLNNGQSNYCAANSSINNISQTFRLRGRNIVSIEWGPWALGMAEGLQSKMSQHGLAMIKPSEGLRILQHILHNSLHRFNT